ncbi:Alpha/Beta hydrolase protein [Fomitopsis serialis]|uniref:Alpha/Beta hydrolase protein n=1 Tax=Fomitopsis serialis TaxID=139415 RepID=UPI002008B748|nr:Alpha/Beta hydrolase protein [Neoantrodia serialis]KAH9924570.1 Alpha/Beta hydrolase protein [Neoantrodia serialis]
MLLVLSNVLNLLAVAKLVTAFPSAPLSGRQANVSTPVVDLGYSQYQGTYDRDTNISYFFGIRYAQAPTGELRWQAPQTPVTTTGVQQATEQPNECYQASDGNNSTNPYRASSLQKRAVRVSQDEDCLFLNVYTPGQLQSGADLPVVVWIHGGGYFGGSASGYSGQDIIKESDYGAITVIIQYRLGVFGFLPGSEVKANGSLNAGLLDQNFALQWVQEHISSFGGDPAKVTIWGESAGAGSVIQHVPPLFRAAMTSSTYLPFQYYYNDTIPEADHIGFSCSSASGALECLRSASASALQATNKAISRAAFYGASVFVPVIDGTFIVERPTVTLEKRRVNGNVLLSVTNLLEGRNFLFPLINSTIVQTIVKQYTSDPALNDTLAQAIGIQGESIFICPTYLLMQAFGANAYKVQTDLQYYFPTAIPPKYNNSELITSFSQSFLSPVVQTTTTSPALLERCA